MNPVVLRVRYRPIGIAEAKARQLSNDNEVVRSVMAAVAFRSFGDKLDGKLKDHVRLEFTAASPLDCNCPAMSFELEWTDPDMTQRKLDARCDSLAAALVDLMSGPIDMLVVVRAGSMTSQLESFKRQATSAAQ